MCAGGTEGVHSGSHDGPLETAEIHDVLRNDRRRHVLERLQETDGPLALGDLAEHIAAVETGETPAPRNVRQSVYVSLHQTHLPKLDELDIVSYERTGKQVRLADHAAEVTVHLEVVPKYGLSWGEYYLGLGVLGLLVQAAGVAGVPVIRDVGSTAFAVGFFLLVIVSAGYHVSTQQTTVLGRLDGLRRD